MPVTLEDLHKRVALLEAKILDRLDLVTHEHIQMARQLGAQLHEIREALTDARPATTPTDPPAQRVS